MQDPSFKYRIVIILTLFFILGLRDFLKNPSNPKRLKEYLFLFSVTGLTMFYGIIHDFCTYSISPEYYVLGKGIAGAEKGFNAEVILIALKATWSVGLVIGCAFLLANNPKKNKRQLNYKRLYRLLGIPLIASIITAGIIGIIFYVNAFRFEPLCETGINIHKRFIAVWGMHIGSYLGGLFGIIIAVIRILRLRKDKTA